MVVGYEKFTMRPGQDVHWPANLLAIFKPKSQEVPARPNLFSNKRKKNNLITYRTTPIPAPVETNKKSLQVFFRENRTRIKSDPKRSAMRLILESGEPILAHPAPSQIGIGHRFSLKAVGIGPAVVFAQLDPIKTFGRKVIPQPVPAVAGSPKI